MSIGYMYHLTPYMAFFGNFCLFVFCLFLKWSISYRCNSINFLMAMQRLSDFIYCQIKVLPPASRYQLRSSWHKECLFFKGSNIQIAVPAVLVLQYPVCQPGVTWFLSPPLSPSTFGVGMLSPSSTLTTVSVFLCMLCYIRYDHTLVTLRKSNAIFHLCYLQVHVEIHLVPSMLSPKPSNIVIKCTHFRFLG